jgi:hypothetical protein
VIRLVPTILSALLLAAHFLREGHTALVVLCLLLPLLLVPGHRTLVRLLQATFVLGSVEWLRTLAQMVQLRWATDEPWIRLSLILGAVVAFTLLTAWWLQRWPLRDGTASDSQDA